MTPDPLALARWIYDRFAVGDIEAVMDHVHPASTWTFPGKKPYLPWAGTYRGLQVLEFFRSLDDTLRYVHYTPTEFHAAGNVVTVLSHERVLVLATEKVYENQLCAVLTFQDGKILRFLEYSDTFAMVEASVDALRIRSPRVAKVA